MRYTVQEPFGGSRAFNSVEDAYTLSVERLLAGCGEVQILVEGPSLWGLDRDHRPRLLHHLGGEPVTPRDGAWRTTTFPAWFWRNLPTHVQHALP